MATVAWLAEKRDISVDGYIHIDNTVTERSKEDEVEEMMKIPVAFRACKCGQNCFSKEEVL